MRMTTRHGIRRMTGDPRAAAERRALRATGLGRGRHPRRGGLGSAQQRPDRRPGPGRQGRHLPALADDGRAGPARGRPVHPGRPSPRTAARCATTSRRWSRRWTRPLDREERAAASLVGAARHEEDLRAGLDAALVRPLAAAVAEIGAARRRAAVEPIDAAPAGAAGLGARGVLVAALHRRRRRRDDRRRRSSRWSTTSCCRSRCRPTPSGRSLPGSDEAQPARRTCCGQPVSRRGAGQPRPWTAVHGVRAELQLAQHPVARGPSRSRPSPRVGAGGQPTGAAAGRVHPAGGDPDGGDEQGRGLRVAAGQARRPRTSTRRGGPARSFTSASCRSSRS